MAETINKKRKKVLGSFPYTTVIFSITLSLTVIGLFGLILINAQSIKAIIHNQVGEVQIYVHNHINDSLTTEFKNSLYSKTYIAKNASGQADITYISKEEAKKEYINQTGQDFTKIIDENPLRASYTIHVTEQYTDSSSMSFIVKELNTDPAVYEVIYEEALLKKVTKNLQNAGIVLAGFALLLTIVTFFLINNTIKLALYSQRFLIRSMQLVGARPFFIQKPFVYRAMIQGGIAGMLASGLLFGLQQYAFATIEDLQKLYVPDQTYMLYGALVVTGVLLGLISSFLSVRKYMFLALDDLY